MDTSCFLLMNLLAKVSSRGMFQSEYHILYNNHKCPRRQALLNCGLFKIPLVPVSETNKNNNSLSCKLEMSSSTCPKRLIFNPELGLVPPKKNRITINSIFSHSRKHWPRPTIKIIVSFSYMTPAAGVFSNETDGRWRWQSLCKIILSFGSIKDFQSICQEIQTIELSC